MSTLTKEQVLKFAAAWQAMIVLITWYINTFGVDTINRLVYGIALLIVLVALFLKKDNTEKVAVAIGTIDRFLESQKETDKAKGVSDETVESDRFDILAEKFLNWIIERSQVEESEPKVEEEPVQDDPEVV